MWERNMPIFHFANETSGFAKFYLIKKGYCFFFLIHLWETFSINAALRRSLLRKQSKGMIYAIFLEKWVLSLSTFSYHEYVLGFHQNLS